MFKEILSAIVDVGLSYSLAEKEVNQFVKTETSKWDGYLPVKFNVSAWNELHNKLKSNPDINYDSLSVQDILRQAEILIRCPKIAMKHVINKENCKTFNDLANIFGVDYTLTQDAFNKYYGNKT